MRHRLLQVCIQPRPRSGRDGSEQLRRQGESGGVPRAQLLLPPPGGSAVQREETGKRRESCKKSRGGLKIASRDGDEFVFVEQVLYLMDMVKNGIQCQNQKLPFILSTYISRVAQQMLKPGV